MGVDSVDEVATDVIDEIVDKSIDYVFDQGVDEVIDGVIDEVIDKFIDRSVDKSIDHSPNEVTDKPIDHSLNEVTDKPIDHSLNNSIDSSLTKPTNPSTHPSKNTPNSHSLAPTASLLFHLLSPLISLIPSNQLPPNPDQLLLRLFERQFLRALLRFLDVDRSRQLQLSRQLANDTLSLQSFWNPREHCFQYNDTESLRCVRNQTAVLPMIFGLEGVLNAEIDDSLGLLLDHRQVSEIGAIYGS